MPLRMESTVSWKRATRHKCLFREGVGSTGTRLSFASEEKLRHNKAIRKELLLIKGEQLDVGRLETDGSSSRGSSSSRRYGGAPQGHQSGQTLEPEVTQIPFSFSGLQSMEKKQEWRWVAQEGLSPGQTRTQCEPLSPAPVGPFPCSGVLLAFCLHLHTNMPRPLQPRCARVERI